MSRFLLIGSDASFEQKLRLAVAGGLPGDVVAVSPESVMVHAEEFLSMISENRPEVIVLGPGLAVEDALRLATVVDVRFPGLSVVLVAETTPELVLQAMRSGVRDVMSPLTDIPSIRILLERAGQVFANRYRTASPGLSTPAEQGLVIGIFSPKGGVGKTTIAANLAVGLGKIAPMNVAVVDLDLQFGDISSALYLDPEHTMVDAVSNPASQDSMVLKAFLTVHPANIYALCAPKDPVSADLITADQVTHVLQQLTAQFKYVVVDTGPGLTEHTLAALEQCTDAVWVAGMDVSSVRSLRTGLDVLRKLELTPDTRHVVLNFADAKSGLSVQDIEASLAAPIDIAIPRSKALSYSANRGIPILQEDVKDHATKGLKALVERFDPQLRDKPRKLHRRTVIQ
ncbi:AAA family ATPase [Arthrobacter crystallopoietes]|uniref:Pilus assembly protein CpaE n=1 Tax=Crystallibacter crystallopoietes TaxID=37928 RepID=A0A1H1F353_9MICC|nr:AAA family ATPase [Arthrobacter crystallopoietes]AUI49658.1 pilus assembly protein CpaE [Arthrobacter crystallopoietes]SDQ95387.1 pilus assembly protein CpaE [Arthrobacter crystallopoietes]